MRRRKTDWFPANMANLLACLAVALGVLASYTSYRAIKAMDEQAESNELAFKVGYRMGIATKTHKAMPPGFGEEQ